VDELQKRKKSIKTHYDFFSPLHRETALLPLADFQWLTGDRLVQRTVFGDRIEMVANFGAADFVYQTNTIPRQSILAKHLDSGKILVFTTAESK